MLSGSLPRLKLAEAPSPSLTPLSSAPEAAESPSPLHGADAEEEMLPDSRVDQTTLGCLRQVVGELRNRLSPSRLHQGRSGVPWRPSPTELCNAMWAATLLLCLDSSSAERDSAVDVEGTGIEG